MNKEVEEAKAHLEWLLDEGILSSEDEEPIKTILNYIQELEEKNEFLRDLRDRLIATIKDDYVPKQKIQDTVEECKNSIVEVENDEFYNVDAIHHNQLVLFAQEILQELLNEEE